MHVKVAKTLGIAGAVMLTVGAVAGASPVQASAPTRDVLLTAGPSLGDSTTALIMGPGGWPDPNVTYMSAIDRIYLEPGGFTGDTVAAPYPWSAMFDGWDDRVSAESNALVEAVEKELASGDFSATNPLVIVGYSESAVAAGQAMSLLHERGVNSDLLHFVLLGDTASAHGGFLSNLLPSLPESLREPIEQLLAWSGLRDLLGATTPTNLYPTDVYSISGDPWADWPRDLISGPSTFSTTLTGMFSTHLEYLGLTPGQISDAVLSNSDGLTDYYTISDTGINFLNALWNAAVSMGDIPDWLTALVG